MLVEVEKFETLTTFGSLAKNSLTGVYSFFVGGKENIKVSRMRFGFHSTEQIDKMIDKLLEVRKKLEK